MDRLDEVRNYDWREIGRRFWPLVRPHRGRALWASVLVGAIGLAVALQPLFAKYVIDEAIPSTREWGSSLNIQQMD